MPFPGPKSGIFNAHELKALIDMGASHIVVYALADPNAPSNSIMTVVGLAQDSSGTFQRLSSACVQYVVPVHNCPPECDNPEIPVVDRVSLHKDSIQ